jgi:hypothetical protein
MKILVAVLMVLPLWSCASRGPFEQAGRDVDESVENVREGVEDVIDDVREGVDDAADEADEAVRRR